MVTLLSKMSQEAEEGHEGRRWGLQKAGGRVGLGSGTPKGSLQGQEAAFYQRIYLWELFVSGLQI